MSTGSESTINLYLFTKMIEKDTIDAINKVVTYIIESREAYESCMYHSS